MDSCFANFLVYIMQNQVVVSTKSPRSDKQYVWEAAADSSSYVIKEETNPENLIQRGTQITLYLRVGTPYWLLHFSFHGIYSFAWDFPRFFGH